MIAVQQANEAAGLSAPVIAGVISGAVALVALAVTSLTTAVSNRRTRRRDAFSHAFAVCVTYSEFPYVIRRRDPADPSSERLRISTELRGAQEKMAYYSVWLHGESDAVADAYDNLVAQTRQIAGRQMHEAWLVTGVSMDADMNMPDLGLGELQEARQAYVAAVRRALEPVRSFLRPRS